MANVSNETINMINDFNIIQKFESDYKYLFIFGLVIILLFAILLLRNNE